MREGRIILLENELAVATQNKALLIFWRCCFALWSGNAGGNFTGRGFIGFLRLQSAFCFNLHAGAC